MKGFEESKISLGLEKFDVLGFRTEDELNQEILKLIQLRDDFESKSAVNSI